MSFEWPTKDIVSTTLLIKKVAKALKDSGGSASEFQDTVAFLESLDKTLAGLGSLLTNSLQLKWQIEIIEQARRLKDAVEEFKKKISKYEPSLGADSERKKAGRVLREIQFALSKSVEELKESLGWSIIVLNHMILIQTLNSILNLAESTSFSHYAWEQRTDIILAQVLLIQKTLEDVNNDTKSKVEELKQLHQASKPGTSGVLEHLETLATEIREARSDIATQCKEDIIFKNEYWANLQHSIKALQECTSQKLQALLKKQEDVEDIKLAVSKLASTQIVNSVIQTLGSGIASLIGAMVVITSQKQLVGLQETHINYGQHQLTNSNTENPFESAGKIPHQVAKKTSSNSDKIGRSIMLPHQPSKAVTEGSSELNPQRGNLAHGFKTALQISSHSTHSEARIGNMNGSQIPSKITENKTYSFSKMQDSSTFFRPGRVFKVDKDHKIMPSSYNASDLLCGFLVIDKDDDENYSLCFAIHEMSEDSKTPSEFFRPVELQNAQDSELWYLKPARHIRGQSKTPVTIRVDQTKPDYMKKSCLALDFRVQIPNSALVTNIGMVDEDILSSLVRWRDPLIKKSESIKNGQRGDIISLRQFLFKRRYPRKSLCIEAKLY